MDGMSILSDYQSVESFSLESHERRGRVYRISFELGPEKQIEGLAMVLSLGHARARECQCDGVMGPESTEENLEMFFSPFT
jgi:hypothetical protein